MWEKGEQDKQSTQHDCFANPCQLLEPPCWKSQQKRRAWYSHRDRAVEQRNEPAEPSEDLVQDVGSETGDQRVKLIDEVRMGAGLQVCAVGVSMPDGFEDTDKLENKRFSQILSPGH